MRLAHVLLCMVCLIGGTSVFAGPPRRIDYELREAQRRLALLGYVPGPSDGLYGPKTKSAIEAFQADHQLTVSGSLDADTASMMRVTPAPEGTSAPESPVVRRLQTCLWRAGHNPGTIDGLIGRQTWIALQGYLADLGHYTGHVDGMAGPRTRDAIGRFQQANGLPATGTIDEPTVAALERAGGERAAVNQ